MPFSRCFTSRALARLALFATLAVAVPAHSQTGKPAEVITGDRCSGVMEYLNEVRATAAGRYTKALMVSDEKCLGVMERIDKARTITRDEYVKAFKHQPDCSTSAYGYLCE